VLKVLLRKSKKHGRMAVYNAWRDWRKKAVAGLYVHHKFATISGPIGGRNTKMILTGSQNFTALGTTANNDLVLRVMDGRMLGQYNTNFAFIRNRYTKRMKKVPLVTRVSDRVGGQ
jgi:phosphatidylserine/phosphatidylglycerophosphate/cardiolipin synthase-like enzyme